MPGTESILTLRDYLRPLRTRWWLIVLFVVVVAGGGVAYGLSNRSVDYTASTRLYIQAPQQLSLVGSSTQSTSYVADQATLMTSALQAQRVESQLGYTGAVSASQIGTTDFVELVATSSTARRAIAIANAYAQHYRSSTTANYRQQEAYQVGKLKAQLFRLKRTTANASSRGQLLQEIDQLQSYDPTAIASIVNPATAVENNHDKVVEYGILGAIVGLIASILLVYLLQGLDPKMRGVQAATDTYGLPVLATVPHDARIDKGSSGVAVFSARSREAFRDLRVGLELAASPGKFQTIAVCSAVPSEGKTSVTRGLALAYTEIGRSVVIVDLDLRRGRLAERFGLAAKPGVSDVIAGMASLEDAIKSVDVTEQDAGKNRSTVPDDLTGFTTSFSVAVVPPGTTPPNPQAVMENPRLMELIDQLTQHYDVVLLDTAPVVPVSDAVPILARADSTVIVARSGITDRRSARLATTVLGRINDLNVAGIVVNDLTTTDAHGYGYAYGEKKYGYA